MRFEIHTGTLAPVLQAYIDCRCRVSVIRGPLGSGKTVASCQRIMTHMIEQRPNRQGIRKSRWIAIRNTFPDLQTTTLRDWLELFEELGKFKAGGIAPPSHTLRFKLPDRTIVHAELIFIALDRPMAIKKLRGLQVTGFWLNELKELDKAIIDMADFRHGRYPSIMDGGPSWHGMIGDTNSPDDDHWLYTMEKETKPVGWEFFTQPGGVTREFIEVDGRQLWTGKWLQNPDAENLNNLPPNYYSAGIEGKDTAWIAVNLANEYGSVHDGKAIYAEQWIEDLHVSDDIELIDEWPIVIGMDFGLTPSAIIGQETPRGALHILEEVIGNGMGIKQFCETLLQPALKNKYKNCEWNFIGDPAGNKRSEADAEQSVFKELDSLGMPTEAAYSNNPLVRWEAVRYFMTQLRDGKPAFRVHRRCKMLIKGFNGGYKLRRIQLAGSEKYTTIADKNKFSHPHDALQYLSMYVRGNTGDSNNDFERPEDDRWSN